jgi:hypothetical protein
MVLFMRQGCAVRRTKEVDHHPDRLVSENCLGLSALGCDCANLDEKPAKLLFLRTGK